MNKQLKYGKDLIDVINEYPHIQKDINSLLKQQKQLSVTETLDKVKEMIEFLEHNRWSSIVDGWCTRFNEKINKEDLYQLRQQLSQLNIKQEK